MTTIIIFASLILFVLGLWIISSPTANKSEFNWGILFSVLSFTLPTIFSFYSKEITLNIIALSTFIIFAIIIIQGIVFIPNKPITEAVITKYGQICWKEPGKTVAKSHGYRFLFLRGIIYNYILIPIEKINFDLGKQKVTTPDNAISFVPAQCTYTPGSKKSTLKASDKEEIIEDTAYNFYNFLKAGGKEGVENILKDQIAEKIRIWASSEKEGPKTWEDLRGAGDEAISVLIKLIAGDTLEPINFEVYTWKLFQFYGMVSFCPEKGKTEIKEREEIEKKIEALEALSPGGKQSLKERVKGRWDIILSLRRGNGTQEIPSLGITLNRFNIGEVELDKRIQQAIENSSIEIAEARAEKIELDNIRARIFEIMFVINEETGKPETDDEGNLKRTGISEQSAIELIQSERGKVPKTITVSRKEFSFDKNTLEMITPLASVILGALKGGKP